DRLGAFQWGRDGEENPSSSVCYLLTVRPDVGTLRLLYSIKSLSAELDYPVQLVTTPCRLGGVRWWFRCPLTKNGVACQRRVRKLYLCGRYFGCRRCHNLTYRSTQESDGRVYAALRGELDLGPITQPGRLSAVQLCLALKVLNLEKKQTDRFCKRPGR